MRKNTGIFTQAEQHLHEAYVNTQQSQRWLDSPHTVSIETYSKCNAACEFCPYPSLERIGTKLSANTVYALIDEVAEFKTAPARLNLTRVNEPFLDPNIFDYLSYANDRLPQTALVLFSNGQPLTERTIERLNALSQFNMLNVSFNEYDPDTYQNVMNIDQRITVKKLDLLHEAKKRNALNFNVCLSRVGTSNDEDTKYLEWCKRHYPLFRATSNVRFRWVGDTTADTISGLAPAAGCIQWFTLHILANGESAFCCIDGDSLNGEFNIANERLINIYNAPSKRAFREQKTLRTDVPACRACLHGMPSAAYTR